SSPPLRSGSVGRVGIWRRSSPVSIIVIAPFLFLAACPESCLIVSEMIAKSYLLFRAVLDHLHHVVQRLGGGELLVEQGHVLLYERVHVEQQVFLIVLEGDTVPSDAAHRRAEPLDEQPTQKSAGVGRGAGCRGLNAAIRNQTAHLPGLFQSVVK